MDNINPPVHLSSSPPPPSEEIVRNLATFLHENSKDYIQVREDDQHYYVEIGRSKAVDQIYRPLHTRVKNIKDKFDSSIQALLTQMLADQKTDNNEAVHATPSKTRARKRPVPKSSSVNKVIISRSKRSSGDRNRNTAASNSKDTISSASGKTLFSGSTSKAQTTDDSISPDAIAENISNLQQNALHLMTELSIDPNTTAPSTSSTFVASTTTNKKKKNKKNSSLKKPFIATEESLVEHGAIIIQESTDNLLTASTGMSTRSRTRQANNNTLVNSAAKTVTKSRKNDAGSVEKLLVATSASKDSHKDKGLVTASPKSLTKLNGGQLKTNRRRSKSASNLNFTPSKPNLVDLSASGLKKAGSASKLTATTSAASSSKGSSNNLTPNRVPRRACAAASSPTLPSTPSSILAATARRNEIELSRQERLILSEDKRKKAEEKKKAILDSRTNALKNAREVRMGKIAKNKKQIDEEKENKLKALGNVGHVVAQSAGPSAPMTKAAARIAQRRAKLLQLEQDEQKANEAAMAEAQSATTSMEKAAPTKATKPAKNKSKTKGGAKKQQPVKPDIEVVPESMEVIGHIITQHYEHLQDVPSASVMSPIAKTSGINGKINETFTAAPNPSYTPNAVDVSASSSTFITAPGPSGLALPLINNNSTFVRPDAPVTPGKATTATSFNLSKSILSKLNDTNNYEMTPPQPERSYDHNYDISQYIDSDDEEQQIAQEEARCGKRVPRWCQGKRFVTQLHNQFSMPPDQLAEWTRRIFPKPVLPVPLDLMGLSVREKYVNRSSSVNWKTAAEIERKLFKDEEDNEQSDGNDNGQK